MKKQILINVEAGERRIAVLAENKLDDYFVERIDQRNIVGNIYKAIVSTIVPAIGAGFINFGAEKNGFLYVTDAAEAMPPDFDEEEIAYDTEAKNPRGHLKISELLTKGQQLLVQVAKEELGTKGARLTTNISLPGRFLVFMPNSNKIGVSKKIRDYKERDRIKDILKAFKLPDGAGLIARTAASGSAKNDLERDIRYLTRQWALIKALSKKKAAPALLWQELDVTSKLIRDMQTEELDKIIIDDKDEYNNVRHVASNFSPELRTRIELYKEDEPLFEKHGIEIELEKIFHRKVYLKCGGYITIEQTEGMVAIDVNSGRFTRKKDPEETIYRVNIEAATKIAQQLRLRDVGGIIVIDFIDMANKQYRKNVFNTLQHELKKDKAKTNIVSFSDLDIVEMTRQRTHKSLESAAYQSCPYCNGKGLVKSADTVSILTMRKLNEFMKKTRTRGPIEVVLHPDVAIKLRADENGFLHKLQRKYRNKITVLENIHLHLEDIEIKKV
ncbi:MAG: Rne/Rng family ribonuclease [Candidatus Omnitrophota bacterium]